MTQQTETHRWVLTTSAATDGDLDRFRQALVGIALDGVWQAVDGAMLRAYAVCTQSPGPAWQQLQPIQVLAGFSAGSPAPFHYVVETDALPENLHLLDDWYAQEHLPGLAHVPGTVGAARYLRLQGSPKSYACYDLTSLDTLRTQPWLAVRHTAWSDRVRPLFRNTVRTGFRRLSGPG